MSSTYIIEKLSMIRIVQRMIERELMTLSLSM